MNGEMLKLIEDAITIQNYKNTGNYVFLGNRASKNTNKFTFIDGFVTESYDEWATKIVEKGFSKFMFFPNIPHILEQRENLGFIGAFKSILLYIKEDKTVGFWQNNWDYNDTEKRWNINYLEKEWQNCPQDIGVFFNKNNEKDLILALDNISKFAREIGANFWAENFFDISINVLNNGDIAKFKYFSKFKDIVKDDKLKIIVAAAYSFVFGAMGSWNDDGKNKAAEKNRLEEYEKLSHNLLENIMLAITYTVNSSFS